MHNGSGVLSACDAVTVAALVLDDRSDAAHPTIAASLAVLAGIAASDAACCAALGERPRAESHAQAIDMMKTVRPGGPELARDVTRLLALKRRSHYGLTFV